MCVIFLRRIMFHSVVLGALISAYPTLNLESIPSIDTVNTTLETESVLLARSVYQRGKASYYGKKFHGRTTANGEKYNMNGLTAAHPSLPFGTKVTVKNAYNGKSVTVRINDRGPFIGGRVIDLSVAAAKKIGMIQSGVVPVIIYK